MTVTINGTSGITTPGVNSTGSNVLGDNVADTLNVGNGAIVTDASGNVGIGTSSPTDSSSFGRALDISSSTGAGVYLRDSSSSTDYGLIGYYGESTHSLYLQARDSSGYIQFQTGGTTERMRIDSSGNLLVGKTAQSSTTVGFEARPTGEVSACTVASTNGAMTVWNAYSTGAAAWRFYVGMGGTVYATNTTISAISDRRYKENIRDLDAGLNEVLALKPRVFDWKEGKGKDIKNDRGFIAQEFEQVFPDLIDEWKDPAPEGEEPYKSVRQDLIPVLVKAIQEQQAQIETLTAKVAALEAK